MTHTVLLLQSHLLLKSRKPCVTIFELIFSGLFCCLLVFGWSRSSDTDHGAMVYAENDFYNITGSLCISNCSEVPHTKWCYRSVDDLPTFPAGTLDYCSREVSQKCECLSVSYYVPWDQRQMPICPVVDNIPKPGAPVDPVPMEPSLPPEEKEALELLFDYAAVLTMMLRPTAIPSLDSLITLQGLGYDPTYNSLKYNGIIGFVPDPKMGDGFNCTAMQHLTGWYFESYVRQNVLQDHKIMPPRPNQNQEYPGCPSVWSSEEEFRKGTEGYPVWAVVIIHELNWEEFQFEVTIRMQSGALPWTFSSYDLFHTQGPWPWEQYITSGFVSIQHFLFQFFRQPPPSQSHFKHHNHTHYWYNFTRDLTSNLVTTPMAAAAFTSNDFLDQSASMLPLIVCISFIFSIAVTCSSVVSDKETRVRQAQLIMGLSLSAYYTAWVVVVVVQSLLSSAISTIILGTTIFKHTPLVMLLLTLFLYAVSVGALALLCSAFLSKVRLAAVVSPVLLLLTVVPKYTLPSSLPMSTRHWLSLLSGCAFSETLTTILSYEQDFIPLHWGDINVDDYSILTGWSFLMVDTAIYLSLWWYLDQVLPSQWGRRKPLWFWLPDFLTKKKSPEVASSEGIALVPGSFSEMDGESEDMLPPSPTRRVDINNIVKQYPGLPKPAVNGVSLTLHEGQISVLLGHNGAGKTTLIDCLTGMQVPTSGDATIYGKSILNDSSSVRQLVGYCPQHNILWPSLTCAEHLIHYYLLKKDDRASAVQKAKELLDLVGLLEKADTQTGKLSGGQKRKLSILLAFCGDSKFVVLDEPTAGVDVKSRRAVWELLKRKELLQNRVVLITTHYMDEADHLGASIAIMNHGKLYCQGSPLYLRNSLGGYNLTLTTNGNSCPDELLSMVQNFTTASSKILSEAVSELRIHIPSSTLEKDVCFPPLFGRLDELVSDSTIRGYGISLTTLEDVFIDISEQCADGTETEADDKSKLAGMMARLKSAFRRKDDSDTVAVPQRGRSDSIPDVGCQADANSDSESPTATVDADHDDGCQEEEEEVADTADLLPLNSERRKTRSRLVRYPRQFLAIFLKRCHFARRDRRTLVFQLLLPMVFLGVTLLIEGISPPAPPDITLDSSLYSDQKVYVDSKEWERLLKKSSSGFDVVSCGKDCRTSVEMSKYVLGQGSEKNDLMAFVSEDSLPTVDTQNGKRPSKGYSGILHNGKRLHSLPIAVATYQNMILSNQSTSGNSSFIKYHNHPYQDNHIQKTYNKIKNVLTAVFVTTPFLLTPAHFCAFLVREREIKALHIQRISGLVMPVYWLANLVFDVLLQVMTCGIAILIFHAADSFYARSNVLPVLAALFGAYSFAVVPFSYIATSRVRTAGFAQSLVICLNFVFGFVLLILSSVLDALPNTKHLNKQLKHVYQVHPAFCLGHGLLKIATRYEKFHPPSRAFKHYYVGTDIIMMVVAGPSALLLLLTVPSMIRGFRRLVKKIRNRTPGTPIHQTDDSFNVQGDVSTVAPISHSFLSAVDEERYNVQNDPLRETDKIKVVELRKKYPKCDKFAVDGVTFGVKEGEVFALLGGNGAGKTSTLSMITGDIEPTSGEVSVSGSFGMCPQHNCCIDNLTVVETLQLYARIRDDALSTINDKITIMGLDKFRNKLFRTLSGGNKRKLGVAVAMMGDSDVLILDEPSAGIDPIARKSLWGALTTEVGDMRRSVLLTTHHLEEVEGLAGRNHRITVLHNGKMLCLGTLQELKTNLGKNYELSVVLSNKSQVPILHSSLEAVFTGTILQEVIEPSSAKFLIPKSGCPSVGDVFLHLERNGVRDGTISDYSVSDTSLDTIILQLVDDTHNDVSDENAINDIDISAE
eukprot:TRINITY_DN18524_c0_g1_i1.p1 TRINITY_DN18524_c0_g1~~TRINITY_DN18524_c0_g1_i1.p1  ORF type:complete len:1855 (+),score=287.27 TRINITY_DN18524_c0_g1_i1:24-5567(+)